MVVKTMNSEEGLEWFENNVRETLKQVMHIYHENVNSNPKVANAAMRILKLWNIDNFAIDGHHYVIPLEED